MNSIIRVSAGAARTRCANPADCLEEIGHLLEETAPLGADIALLPSLALCSPACGSFFDSPLLLEQCAAALGELQALTAEREGYVIAGLAIDDFGKAVSAMAVLHRGELIGLIPTVDNPAPLVSTGLSSYLLPVETTFACGDMRFCVLGCSLDNLAPRLTEIARTGCDLVLIPSYTPMRAGLIRQTRQLLRSLCASLGCAAALVNGGVGDTSSPYVYQGFVCISEGDKELAFTEAGTHSFHGVADLDLDMIRAEKRVHTAAPVFHSIPGLDKPDLLRKPSRTPFLPARARESYLDELFELQVRSLASRMENIGVSRLVIGVSGGLDSTAALLVCAGAVDALELPRENILAVTMPGFGTSDGTYYNALRLIEQLGAEKRDIPIREAVRQHFEDIGHSGRGDTTYENAQARERGQILFDLANLTGALVVGTGDLSEAALGFCTFGGDHLAGYNVNICIPKTLLRALTARVAGAGRIAGVLDTVEQVLDTPVSPELLPPDADGSIAQRTEELLGPYELHDFFLYHFLRYRLRPAKLHRYACAAFAGVYTPEFICQTLETFLGRFCASAFKRACAPDAAAVTRLNLLGPNFAMPSDLDPSFLLQDLRAARPEPESER